jgi:hypothetical protein
MSYYDFDDHFWSAEKVCIQLKPLDSNNKSTGIKLTNILLIIFVTVLSGLLIKILVSISSSNLNKNIINPDNFGSNCLMLKRDDKMQIYCN